MSKKIYIDKKKGMSPGSLIFTGFQKIPEVKISLITYEKSYFNEIEIENLNELKDLDKSRVNWINIRGLHQIDIVEELGNIFNIHSLNLEDVLNVNHPPKIEEHEDYLFIVIRMIDFEADMEELDFEQISFIVSKNLLITFQEKDGNIFDPIKDRIRSNKGLVRKFSSDYLAYRLLDTIIDNYFSVMEKLDDELERIEDEISESPTKETFISIQRLRKQIIQLRRAVFPLRDIVYSLLRDKLEFINRTTFPYLRDISDHIRNIMDTIENYREIINGIQEIYLSNASLRMNEIMKVLTIIASFFIPLTFIVGIYGMNFNTASRWNMPELNFYLGYPLVWLLMVMTVLALYYYFKRKKWF